VAPQFIPAGELVTVPVPVPVFVTVRLTGRLKFAVTDLASLIVRVHVPVPLHAPDQPVKEEGWVGVAFSVITAFCTNPAEHVAPQFMPAGELVTVPVPVPDLATVRATGGSKFAVTVLALSMATAHVPVPLHAPDQPVKVEFWVGAAVSMT
jgi:hypothetical protein